VGRCAASCGAALSMTPLLALKEVRT
jgi:hypothetical protein